jgi:hypothetical protein
MNEKDLRDCFAMFAMAGWIMNGDYCQEEVAVKAYEVADLMLKARNAEPEVEEGIVAVKPKRRVTK